MNDIDDDDAFANLKKLVGGTSDTELEDFENRPKKPKMEKKILKQKREKSVSRKEKKKKSEKGVKSISHEKSSVEKQKKSEKSVKSVSKKKSSAEKQKKSEKSVKSVSKKKSSAEKKKKPEKSVSRKKPEKSVSRKKPVKSVSRKKPEKSVSRKKPVKSVSRKKPVKSVSRKKPANLEKYFWPFPDFLSGTKYRDLAPFKQAILKEAKEEYEKKNGVIKDDYDRAYWKFVYENYSQFMLPSDVNDDKSARLIPTSEFPWSNRQLRENLPRNLETREDYFKHRDELKMKEKPDYDFDLIKYALENASLFHTVQKYAITHYVPWNPRKILHFLVALVPDQVPIPVTDQKLSEEEALKVRMTLMRVWPEQPLLQKYIRNLVPEPFLKQNFARVAPFETLLTGYSSWNRFQEYPEEKLNNIWANSVILRTYDFLKMVDPTTTYLGLFTEWATETKQKFKLYNTPSGILYLTSDYTAQMEQRNIPFSEHKANKKLIITQVQNLLKHAREITKEEKKPEDYTKALAKKLSFSIIPRVREVGDSLDGFLHILYRIHPEFRAHLAYKFVSMDVIKYLYLTQKSKKNEVERIEKMKINERKKFLTEWMKSGAKEAEIVEAFEQEMQTLLYDVVPLVADSLKFQKYIRAQFPQYILPAVSSHPEKSTCELVEVSKRGFITPDNAQIFVSEEFHPGSYANGKICIHSVGSGKTCLAVRIGSRFARAGFRIVWVTKTSLRTQVLKNHVAEICNLLIKEQYDYIYWLQGADAAEQWLGTVPKQTNFQSVIHFLKKMGMDWVNLSYRQLSNALEDDPKNEIGRDWNNSASLAAMGDVFDPLRKTLLIIDEAHKMFTGELDRTELPHVAVIKKQIQESYRMSENNRVRVLFLTATPTTQTVLPLFNMINMLHAHDVFPYEMQTVNPHITTDEGLLDTMEKLKEVNRDLETQAACTLFPLKRCGKQEEKEDEEEEEEDAGKVQAFFDAKSIIGATTFQRNDLKNNLEDFWRKAFGLISYYNISADYSKFPRVEYKSIIMPSCSMLQERLIASELVSNHWRDLSLLTNKIRQISAWAIFQSTTSESRRPTPLDQLILDANAKETYFEATLEDLIEREKLLREAIVNEKEALPNPEDLANLEKYQKLSERDEKEYQILLTEYEKVSSEVIPEQELYSRKKGKSTQLGLLTKKMGQRKRDLELWQGQLQTLGANVEFFQTQKKLKVAYLEKKLKRVEQRIKKAEAQSKSSRDRHNLSKFLNATTEEKLEALPEEKDDEEDNVPKKKKNTRGRKTREESESEDEDEVGEDLVYDEQEAEQDDVYEKKAGEYYTKKTWVIDKKSKLPEDKPKAPKKHYFDQPDTFDAEQFLQDMPLYSPAVTKLMEVMRDNDKFCEKTNGENDPKQRLRKSLIFCQDIHSIRAVAGALMAKGWTFGMKRKWVKWEKSYYSLETNKQLGKTVQSKSKQLTWLPDDSEGEDYSRFVILTRSKIGGVSGATLNEYAIQSLGAKGEEATYNHIDNVRGKNYRVVIIDRNFVEGIDLPSTFCHLYDSVLANSTRTQIVGRISRFCGSADLPFVPNYGWPAYVYRYGLKFHGNSLHLTPSQQEKFHERVNDPRSLFAQIIPEPFRDGFVEKIDKNLFSPVELQVLLSDNMEIQRIKKKTLDVYEALMEKVSIGSLLYAPAMRNLQMARSELDELLIEEDEVEQEYKQEIFNRDTKREQQSAYALRSQNRKLMDRFQFDDGPMFSMVQYHVTHAMRKTALDQVDKWKSPERRESFFNTVIRPDLADAQFLTVSHDTVRKLMNDMFAEKVSDMEKVLETRNKKRQAKLDKKQASQLKKQQKLEAQEEKAILNAIKASVKPKDLKKNPESITTTWNALTLTMPNINRLMFDRVIARMLTKKEQSKSKAKEGSRKAKEASRKGKEGSRKAKEGPRKAKEISSKPRKVASVTTAKKAVELIKKKMKIDKRRLKHKEAKDGLIQAVKSEYPNLSTAEITEQVEKIISGK